MPHDCRTTVTFVVWLLFAPQVWGAPTPADAALEAVRELDNAATFAEARVQDRCGDSQVEVDLEAETALLSAAYIHMVRMERAKELNEPVEVLTPVALQAARDFRRAYMCNRKVVGHIEMAIRLLTSMRQSLPASAPYVLEEVDKELATLVALEQLHQAATNEPAPLARAPRVRIVTLDAGDVSLKTPLRDSYLARLSLRVDLGFGAADLDGVRKTQSGHRGFYFRAHLLARFKPGEQKSTLLLFGPYYNVLRAMEPSGRSNALGDAPMHGFGAHFEVQWTPPRADPWLSLHPFVDMGIEHVGFLSQTINRSGFQLGGGALICGWHASFCPNIRVMTVPGKEGRDRPTIQLGMALDVLRLVDLGLSHRRAHRAGAGGANLQPSNSK